MRMMLKAGTSAAVLLTFIVFAPGLAKAAAAADVSDSGCSLNGAVTIGYMFTDSNFSEIDGNYDWETPFGEAAGLVTCDAWNFQADFASYAHEADIDGKTLDDTEGHFGGAAFWRDPDAGAFGVSASMINHEFFGKDNDYWRLGAFGEFYVSDQFTLGGGVHYFTSQDDFFGKDHDGFEFTANAKFYVMPKLSLSVQGDYMISEFDGSGDSSIDGYAVSGEAKYLVFDEGLSLFAGGRYAERTLGDDDADIEDLQVYVGLEFAFGGGGGSLAASDRSGKYDNTSVMLEKLPSVFNEIFAAACASGGCLP